MVLHSEFKGTGTDRIKTEAYCSCLVALEGMKTQTLNMNLLALNTDDSQMRVRQQRHGLELKSCVTGIFRTNKVEAIIFILGKLELVLRNCGFPSSPAATLRNNSSNGAGCADAENAMLAVRKAMATNFPFILLLQFAVEWVIHYVTAIKGLRLGEVPTPLVYRFDFGESTPPCRQ